MSQFALCDHVFGVQCSGEVVNLIKGAERYGFLMESAKARIVVLCRRCRKGPSPRGSRRTSALEMMFYHFPLDHKDHVFTDVGGEVGDPFQVLRYGHEPDRALDGF